MALVKWEDPFKSVRELLDPRRFLSWIEDFDKDLFQAPQKITFAPVVDIYEKDGKIHIDMELPGVKKEDIEIRLEGDQLIISGEVKEEEEVKKENYYRSERRYGKFERRFTVSENLKPEDIEATYKDGILKIVLPKLEEEEKKEVKKIEVK